MSATKPTLKTKPVCWLCQMELGFYSHNIESQGKIIHFHCLTQRGYSIDAIYFLSGPRKADPKALAEQTFNTHLYDLNLSQLDQLTASLRAIEEKRREHYHHCFQCGCVVECYKGEGCTETEDECRPCHEGMSKRQFERLVARSL